VTEILGRINIVKDPPPRDEEVFKLLRTYTQEWFRTTFGKFLEPQKYAIPRIKARRSTLIFSPTGSGKTLAAFLGILDELFRLAEDNKLDDKVYCIYISPLRALSNDIHKNLQIPMQGIRKTAEKLGYELPEIRILIRHGDTPSHHRSKMLKYPPHIIITTPESLANMMIAPKFRYLLYDVSWVIVDEVHELSDSKRGAHLSLSLERLQHFAGDFTRIGLSATQAPVTEIAKWLVGFDENGFPRPCDIIQVLNIKQLDLKVICPTDDLKHKEAASQKMYEILKDLVKRHRTTIIFTNTRAGAEALAYKLKKIMGKRWESKIGVHHSSLGREIRLDVENSLKDGKLRAVVTSTSLELGIDIGYVDLVVQIGSPKSVIKGLQRIGRAGHAIHKISRGIFVALDEDDLIELLVLSACAYKGKLDRVSIPKNCLDVLAQQLVAMSIEKRWNVDEAYKVVRGSYNFHELPFEDFIAVLNYLAGKHVDLEYQKVYRKLWLDDQEKTFGRKRGSRVIFYLNQGTIPDETKYQVLLKKNGRFVRVGHLSEPFAERLIIDDIFVLAGRKYKVTSIKTDTIVVTEAKEENPTVPSWIGEQLPRSFDLSIEMGEFQERVERLLNNSGENEVVKMLIDEYGADEKIANNILRYFKDQIEVTGCIPNHRRILIETWVDESGRHHMIFHARYGRRICDALSRFFAYISSEIHGCNVGIGVTDNGFDLVFPPLFEPDPRKILAESLSRDFANTLRKAIKNTELFANRFRHVANRSFMILRNYRGTNISVKKQRIRVNALVPLLPDDFPVIKETYREILDDYMDARGAEEILSKVKTGEIEVKIVEKNPRILSPFAQGIVLAVLSDVLTMEDRERFIIAMYEQMKSLVDHAGSQNQGAFEQH